MQLEPRENDTRETPSSIESGTAYAFYDLKEAASLTGVPRRTIQYWVQKGLFVPSAHYSTSPGDPHLLTYSDLEKITILNAVRFKVDLRNRGKGPERRMNVEAGASVSRWMKAHGVPRKGWLVVGKELVTTIETGEELVEMVKGAVKGENDIDVRAIVDVHKVLQELEARISIPEE